MAGMQSDTRSEVVNGVPYRRTQYVATTGTTTTDWVVLAAMLSAFGLAVGGIVWLITNLVRRVL